MFCQCTLSRSDPDLIRIGHGMRRTSSLPGYDAYYSDYHEWNSGEVVYYQQWSRENHRDEHREFRKLKPEEQKEYWNWRHSHGDHDHDHDKDRH
jgi:hypothetical protein